MPFLPGPQYLQLPRCPKPWIVQDLLPASGLLNLYGTPKGGKSLMALGMGIAIASGARSWLDFDVLDPGPVAYLQCDTPRSIWMDNHLAHVRRAGYDTSAVHFEDMQSLPEELYPFDICTEAHRKYLVSQLAPLSPKVLILDTLREINSRDENDNTATKEVFGWIQLTLRLINPALPPACILISHPRKGLGGAAPPDDLMRGNRGASYIAGRADCIAMLAAAQGERTGTLTFAGRATELDTRQLLRDPESLLWGLDPSKAAQRSAKAHELLHQHSAELAAGTLSLQALAKQLVDLTGASLSTCRRDLDEALGKAPRRASRR